MVVAVPAHGKIETKIPIPKKWAELGAFVGQLRDLFAQQPENIDVVQDPDNRRRLIFGGVVRAFIFEERLRRSGEEADVDLMVSVLPGGKVREFECGLMVKAMRYW